MRQQTRSEKLLSDTRTDGLIEVSRADRTDGRVELKDPPQAIRKRLHIKRELSTLGSPKCTKKSIAMPESMSFAARRQAKNLFSDMAEVFTK